MWIVLVMIAIGFLAWIDFYLGHKQTTAKEEPPVNITGNMHLLTTGSHFFDSLFQDIDQANKSIYIQFYILRDDELGQELCRKLIAKAHQGLEVRLLLDYMGSYGLKKKTVNSLKDAGVHFEYSNKPQFPYLLYRINHRNHRKITIIDSEIGYLGGYNVGNEYIGRVTRFGDWRDYHLKLRGKVVIQLQRLFIDDWNGSTNEKMTHNETSSFLNEEEAKELMLLPSKGQAGYRYFYTKIKGAKKSIFIGSPYFIPGKKMNRELLSALHRGVNVKLLVPMNPDHPFVQEASYRFVKPLLEAGAEIYQFHEGFYHSKIVMFDDTVCDIGTANFDLRSFFYNDELNCIFTDKSEIQAVKQVLASDLERSEKLTLARLKKTRRTVKVRLKEVVGFVLSPFL
ncbi:cardiolipin synthase [Fictibacillus sp. 18YEL24]|uniref:cardiolipin synthase n=1 Tax=Fictibacillus sp. 18YEL24 TaxID=2745875 RepID=UPI0018CEBB48|nr:cardiolipin synthase [Fictibacillus sp. 18YEL24]MBH0168947.1 cardiolipin synthase [Fictibacillus sp. 18YEL24]